MTCVDDMWGMSGWVRVMCVCWCLEDSAGAGVVQVARSTDFRRDGFDIHSDVVISFSQVSACVCVFVCVPVYVCVCARVCACVNAVANTFIP